jgi:hypothetical protein
MREATCELTLTGEVTMPKATELVTVSSSALKHHKLFLLIITPCSEARECVTLKNRKSRLFQLQVGIKFQYRISNFFGQKAKIYFY